MYLMFYNIISFNILSQRKIKKLKTRRQRELSVFDNVQIILMMKLFRRNWKELNKQLKSPFIQIQMNLIMRFQHNQLKLI